MNNIPTQICSKCKESKFIEKFGLISSSKTRKSICKECYAKYASTWRKAHKEKHNENQSKYRKSAEGKNALYLRRYGITIKDYEELLEKQNFSCRICKQPVSSIRRLDVDHDHKTGHVRGLLCNKCNQAIGLFQDNPKLLIEATDYLLNWSA